MAVARFDITEQEQLIESVRKSESELRQILDLAPQLVGVLGPHAERLYANRVTLSRSGSKFFLSEKLAAAEREIIEEALRESQGRTFGPSGAAAKLGIARSTLESKIQSLNINKNRFKSKSRRS